MRSVHVVFLFALVSGPVLLPVIYFYFIMPMYANHIFVFFFLKFFNVFVFDSAGSSSLCLDFL